jgi:predicted regulator of Ras-like GTPase activity (Roadblock/LC7/MglB family)
MYCRKCGKELEADARYCSYCGTSVEASRWEEVNVAADDLIGRVKKLIKEGNVRRIIIKNEKGQVMLEIPVTAAAIGAIIAPYLAALGAIAAIATRATIHIERRTEEEITPEEKAPKTNT